MGYTWDYIWIISYVDRVTYGFLYGLQQKIKVWIVLVDYLGKNGRRYCLSCLRNDRWDEYGTLYGIYRIYYYIWHEELVRIMGLYMGILSPMKNMG